MSDKTKIICVCHQNFVSGHCWLYSFDSFVSKAVKATGQQQGSHKFFFGGGLGQLIISLCDKQAFLILSLKCSISASQ